MIEGAAATKIESLDSNQTIGKTSFKTGEEVLSLVENAPTNIMVANKDLEITYINPKSYETLKQLEHLLPIKVDEMVGASIDVFHKAPEHQRKMLATDKHLPHSAIIEVGDEKLDLLVTACYDTEGNYTGPQVTWDVVTEKLKAESEMARISSMVESVPVNIIMADRDLNITFMNPASTNTLKKLQNLLPIPVDQIVGSSVDVFHKNPEHQRNLLKDDSNLPHRAKIKLGEDTLDLLVSPIYDNNNQYIGPMVTWEVISEKVTLVNTLAKTAQELGAAAEELTATATQLSANSKRTSESSTSASSSTEEVSQGVQSVAANIEEMSASIKEIANSSNQAAEMSQESMQESQSTNQIINELGESSHEIGNVIKMISSIAQQTNLLALNATIEAARAGEAGKGFAVVANEVKELAKQTGKATEEITQKIQAIQASSKESVEAIGRISESSEKLNGISTSIAAAIEEQKAAANEVTRVMQDSNKAVNGIGEVIRDVSTAAEESNTGAESTLQAARGLNDLAVKLKNLVDDIEV